MTRMQCHTHACYGVVLYIGAPPVRNPTASHSETPADLSGFDIRISWDVSGLCTYRRVCIVVSYMERLSSLYIHA